MTFDFTIHLGDLVNVGLGGILMAIGHGLRKTYQSVAEFVERVDHIDHRLETTSEVVDHHTDLLVSKGLLKPPDIRRTSRRRRREDLENKAAQSGLLSP